MGGQSKMVWAESVRKERRELQKSKGKSKHQKQLEKAKQSSEVIWAKKEKLRIQQAVQVSVRTKLESRPVHKLEDVLFPGFYDQSTLELKVLAGLAVLPSLLSKDYKEEEIANIASEVAMPIVLKPGRTPIEAFSNSVYINHQAKKFYHNWSSGVFKDPKDIEERIVNNFEERDSLESELRKAGYRDCTAGEILL